MRVKEVKMPGQVCSVSLPSNVQTLRSLRGAQCSVRREEVPHKDGGIGRAQRHAWPPVDLGFRPWACVVSGPRSQLRSMAGLGGLRVLGYVII